MAPSPCRPRRRGDSCASDAVSLPCQALGEGSPRRPRLSREWLSTKAGAPLAPATVEDRRREHAERNELWLKAWEQRLDQREAHLDTLARRCGAPTDASQFTPVLELACAGCDRPLSRRGMQVVLTADISTTLYSTDVEPNGVVAGQRERTHGRCGCVVRDFSCACSRPLGHHVVQRCSGCTSGTEKVGEDGHDWHLHKVRVRARPRRNDKGAAVVWPAVPSGMSCLAPEVLESSTAAVNPTGEGTAKRKANVRRRDVITSERELAQDVREKLVNGVATAQAEDEQRLLVRETMLNRREAALQPLAANDLQAAEDAQVRPLAAAGTTRAEGHQEIDAEVGARRRAEDALTRSRAAELAQAELEAMGALGDFAAQPREAQALRAKSAALRDQLSARETSAGDLRAQVAGGEALRVESATLARRHAAAETPARERDARRATVGEPLRAEQMALAERLSTREDLAGSLPAQAAAHEGLRMRHLDRHASAEAPSRGEDGGVRALGGKEAMELRTELAEIRAKLDASCAEIERLRGGGQAQNIVEGVDMDAQLAAAVKLAEKKRALEAWQERIEARAASIEGSGLTPPLALSATSRQDAGLTYTANHDRALMAPVAGLQSEGRASAPLLPHAAARSMLPAPASLDGSGVPPPPGASHGFSLLSAIGFSRRGCCMRRRTWNSAPSWPRTLVGVAPVPPPPPPPLTSSRRRAGDWAPWPAWPRH